MKKTDPTSDKPAARPNGSFSVSSEPVVTAKTFAESGSTTDRSTTDALYVIARDPKSLFAFWEVDWPAVFSRAGVAVAPVQLRAVQEETGAELLTAVNTLLGYAFVEVAEAGANYRCELGCLAEDGWKSLLVAEPVSTPCDSVSDDLSAEFATLPMHLSFQRLLDLLRPTGAKAATIAQALARLERDAANLQGSLTPAEWSRFKQSSAAAIGGSELFELLRSAQRPSRPEADPFERWKHLGEQTGGSSWAGAS